MKTGDGECRGGSNGDLSEMDCGECKATSRMAPNTWDSLRKNGAPGGRPSKAYNYATGTEGEVSTATTRILVKPTAKSRGIADALCEWVGKRG